jgi:hypothetical protein
VNHLTNVIAEFQSELKAWIPKIIGLLAHSDGDVRSRAADMIKALGERGK